MFSRANPLVLLAFLALGVVAGACGDTLLDHRASPELLGPACAANQVSCGGACLTCNTPANALPVCQAGGCGFACVGGFNSCGGPSCIAESDTSCGASCQDCTAGLPADATGACSTATHACETTCSPGFIKSGATCQRATAVSSGYVHGCALLADQTVKCWGANGRGQLGQGNTVDHPFPVGVPLPGPAKAVFSGYAHSCAIVDRGAPGATGEVWCWGDNGDGETGSGSALPVEPSPVEAVGLTGVLGLGGGNTGESNIPSGHTCAILADRSLRCWGAGTSGQLGDGGTASQGTPVAVTVLATGTQVAEIVGGEGHTCALTTGGAVYCWGANDKGQLGIGTTGAQTQPATAAVAAGATQIAAGDLHACAIVAGTLECWGWNVNGQVDPTTKGSIAYLGPRVTQGLGGSFSPVVLGAGRAHTCAEKAGVAEAPKCFGDNLRGQLGNQPFTIDIADALLSPPAQAIGGGSNHTCALTGGGVQCWGDNTRGQLGRGTVTQGPEFQPAYVSGR